MRKRRLTKRAVARYNSLLVALQDWADRYGRNIEPIISAMWVERNDLDGELAEQEQP